MFSKDLSQDNRHNMWPGSLSQKTPAEDLDLLEKKSLLLKEISGAIAATGNVSVIGNLMLDFALKYVNAEKGSLMLLNEHDELYISAARGVDFQYVEKSRLRIGEGIAGAVAKNSAATLVKDIEKDERFTRENRNPYRTRSFISCPVMSKNTLIGVININDKRDGSHFTEDELALLTVIANLAAVAIESALLMTQLNAKAAELEEMNRKLIDADVVKTEFFTRMSHELRTPLNSIKGAVYYLQQPEKTPGRHTEEFYHIIAHETDKLIDTVEDLLAYAGLEHESQVIRKSVISLPDLLKDIVNLPVLKTKLARRDIRLRLNIKETLSTIVGNRMKLAQLFVNLIEGLSLYLNRGDSLEISAHEADVVTVNFTLSRRLPETIISDFFTSRRIFHMGKEGAGLNLSLAGNVVDMHRWNLSASQDDYSSRISLEIPKSTKQKQDAVIGLAAEMLLDFISELMDLNICSIMLTNPSIHELTILCARGLEDDVIKRTRVRCGNGIAGWVAREGKPLLIEDIERDPLFGRRSIPQYNSKSLLVLPLKQKDEVMGVMNLNNKKTAEPFNTIDLHIASVLSERLSSIIDGIKTGAYGEADLKGFFTSFETLLSAVKIYRKKSRFFPALILRVMERLGAAEEIKKISLYVSLVYDLGMMAIDGGLLNKDTLSPLDIRMIKVHPYTTLDLLKGFEFSRDVKKAILHHHERFDGTGYPEHLKEDQIPFISRVLSVVDAFCAMVAERPYRKAFTTEEALHDIEKNSGSMYDPEVVKALRDTFS